MVENFPRMLGHIELRLKDFENQRRLNTEAEGQESIY